MHRPLVKQDENIKFSNFLKLFVMKRRSTRVSVRFQLTEMVSDSLISNVNHQEETRV